MNNRSPLEKLVGHDTGICRECGFCCDGTLFDNAVLCPGERAFLPEKMAENYHKNDGQELLSLPCPYFDGICTIYRNHKPKVCSTYFCRLSGEVSEKKTSVDQALRIIRNVMDTRKEISGLYRTALNTNPPPSFRKMLAELRLSGPRLLSCGNPQLIVLLVARANILDSLLTRHFKSKRDFNQMIIHPGT
jgi:hypothetical protein